MNLKALIIDEPWIEKILSGLKTWEMRKHNCNLRGWIGLIRKGSGLVVGVAEILGSETPIATLAEYADSEHRHGVPPERQRLAFNEGWRTPWVLQHAKRLVKPVPYKHPSGAVIWVNLHPSVAKAVEAQV
ncbi:MAG TPA: hypothetical protein VHE09_14675 [Rhizomicrobium sp.]|nr:hypothetical protein [Rhizomicrobium sp.]